MHNATIPAAHQFQPSMKNSRNQWANMVKPSSTVKMRVKNMSSESSKRPVALGVPSGLVSRPVNCICITLAPKFCAHARRRCA